MVQQIDLATVLSELVACLRSLEETRPGVPFAHAAVEVDRQVLQRGGVYHGGVLKGSSSITYGTVDVYDGLDTSGELIHSLAGTTTRPMAEVLERGIALRVGLYVDIGSNVDKFTVYYQPTPREKG